MQQQPSADKVDSGATDGKHQLPKQDKPDETYVLVLDADIHNGLGKEWKDKLRKTSDYQAQDDLSKYLRYFFTYQKKVKDLFSLIFLLSSILWVKKVGVVSKNIAMPLSCPLEFVLIQCFLNSSRL